MRTGERVLNSKLHKDRTHMYTTREKKCAITCMKMCNKSHFVSHMKGKVCKQLCKMATEHYASHFLWKISFRVVNTWNAYQRRNPFLLIYQDENCLCWTFKMLIDTFTYLSKCNWKIKTPITNKRCSVLD